MMADRLVRYGVLTGYPELAGSLGLDAPRIMRSVGLDIDEIVLEDKWVPGAAVARLLEMSAQQSGYEDFGVRMSRLRRFSDLGPLSVALHQEPDLRSALDVLIRYERAYNGVLDLRLVEDGGLAHVEVWMDLGLPVPVRQCLDETAAVLVAAIRTLLSPHWSPLTAYFAHAAPSDRSTFVEVFGPVLRFDHTFTGIVFPSRDLYLPTIGADPALRPYARQFLQSLGSPGDSTVVQVRSLLEVLLPSGGASMAHVSRRLAVRPRTLHRQLAEEGVSFSAILHTTRASLAERYLPNDRYSLTDISGMLGFAAPSAFSTWFRSQFGTTPSEWRAQTGATAPALIDADRRA